MSGFFYNLGRMVGPKVRKAQWIWQSLTGNEADAIKVETDVGRDLAREIRHQLDPELKSNINQIFRDIGPRLSECVANRSRTFSFETIKGSEPNAFALPGGFIFVTGSLVELCHGDNDELAFILAHEMSHVIRGHAMKRIISNSAINLASHAVSIRGQLTGWIQKVGVQFLINAYSQEMESQADLLGVRLAEAAGYHPDGAVKLFRRLAKLNLSDNQFNLGRYFSSHPPFDARIRVIRHFLDKHK